MNLTSKKITKHHNLIKHGTDSTIDMILIGAGIMSITLGIFLKIIKPNWNIHIYERLKKPAQESSNAWNNAGTGHAAFCELNYTPYNHTRNFIDTSKAIVINQAFELSLQFWAYLVKNNILVNPKSFINNVPHMSFVWGEKNICFLKQRFKALQNNIIFKDMLYSESFQQIQDWAPLLIQGRNTNQKVAATYMKSGTDVNFGEITQQILCKLKENSQFSTYFQHNVTNIQRCKDKKWAIKIIDPKNKKKIVYANYVFIGSGGQSLNLLQTSNIQKITGYAGFPVGAQFLITKNPYIIAQHSAKVYGKASIHEPPMSAPHIDTRILNDNKVLLFGPFATFSSKFLKYGSWLDLFQSINKSNIIPMLQVGIDNFNIIKYLIKQSTMSHSGRIKMLKKYYPEVDPSDWSLLQAGKRVQIIKKNKQNRGSLEFGTEIIGSDDNTLLALLGASPGASTSVKIVLQILSKMFNNIQNNTWEKIITTIIPLYNKSNDIKFIKDNKQHTREILELTSSKNK